MLMVRIQHHFLYLAGDMYTVFAILLECAGLSIMHYDIDVVAG